MNDFIKTTKEFKDELKYALRDYQRVMQRATDAVIDGKICFITYILLKAEFTRVYKKKMRILTR